MQMVRNKQRDCFARLQAHGHRLTRPRRSIIETLITQSRAMTASDLHRALAARGVSLASIYRTLELLTRLGLAEPVRQAGEEARYIVCQPGHHHHVICTRCWHVADVDACLIEPVAAAIHDATSFEIDSHILEFYGRCRACQR